MIAVADVHNLPLADASVDLVFCSPPYEAARTYGIGFNLRGQEWVDWALKGFMECLRACRGLVAWVVEGQTRNYRYSCTPALLMADLHRAGVCLRKPPIYKRYGIPGSGGPDWLRNDWEWVICATAKPGKLPWSENCVTGHVPKYGPGGEMSHRMKNGRRVNGRMTYDIVSTDGYRNGDLVTKRIAYAPPDLANPGNVIDCGAVGGGRMGDSYLTHEGEAPFPENLAEVFVRSFCPPGGTVLDPFSGSGTTAAVAQRFGRKFIAFDIRQSQCDLTRRRLDGNQLALEAAK